MNCGLCGTSTDDRSTAKNTAKTGARLGAAVGGRSGPFAAGLAAGLGGAVGYLAGAAVDDLEFGLDEGRILPDGGRRSPDSEGERTGQSVAIPVTEET